MNKNTKTLILALVAILALGSLGACKHSGMAVTERGQILAINITGADDLPDGYTDTLRVSVDNRGVANLSNVEFTVEIPNELVVVSEKHGDGIDLMPMQTPSGTKLYHYTAGDIGAAQSSKAEFEVRTAFGSLDRTGDIKVTAWQKDVLGDKLVETKMIKLRR
jgi:hypothetical protein